MAVPEEEEAEMNRRIDSRRWWAMDFGPHPPQDITSTYVGIESQILGTMREVKDNWGNFVSVQVSASYEFYKYNALIEVLSMNVRYTAAVNNELNTSSIKTCPKPV
ncbi:unnamed protein product [Dovyalis caffra]|uniref:Uncharacterized protein n=1 Tax=Dovyalis caffra TaxID=77055 RepID=A0AAV1RWH7_9ROSI|nr:unnamed protein product [Dovyalis caffra]